jgi:hypothetical protein
MTFENLKMTSECQCLIGAKEDTENKFYRRISNENLVDKHFATHFERGIGANTTECAEICSKKGVSVNIAKPGNEEDVLKKYLTTFKFNPNKGSFCIKFRIDKGAGVVKSEPLLDDESHMNFFKSDSFSIKSLVDVETIQLA